MALLKRNSTSNADAELQEIRRMLQQERAQSGHLAESVQELERFIMEDQDWRALDSRLEREFTRGGLDRLMRVSRAMYLSHPLIQRAVNVRAYYTWGQGVAVQAAEESVQEAVVGPLMEEQGNRAELFAHQARILTDVDQSVDGNNFMAMPTDVQGNVKLRTIPANEIRQIFTNPKDKREIWWYLREWTEVELDPATQGLGRGKHRKALYPDWHFRLEGQVPDSIGSLEVVRDSPIAHLKTGGLKTWMFGAPETFAAIDWARAYRKFLEDWHTLVASLARFAWRATTSGRKVDDLTQRLQSSIPDTGEEDNPPPIPGSVFVGTEDDSITPIPKTGAHTSADDGRPSRLMVGAAMDLPDTILTGDTDVGNLATARSLDRPTELAISSRQQLMSDWWRDIFTYAARMRQQRAGLGNIDLAITISFPPILEHDANNVVSAIVSAATLEGKLDAGTLPRERVSRMLLEALGVEDVESALEDLDDEERNSLAQAVERLAEVVKR